MKYLGVRVTCDRSEQTKISREQIDKNVKILRWKIGKADPDVVQQLTCCLARAMLIYIGTPMVAAGLWKRVDVDGIEASLYRKIMRIGNNIPNKAILNTMTNIRLAGEVINYLSRSTQDEFRKQHRVTKYFDMMHDDGHTTRGGATQLRGDATQRRTDGAKALPRREKIYVPKIMMDTMLSVTGNCTSMHFGYGHLCRKHNKLFSLSHIEECNALSVWVTSGSTPTS